MVGDEERVVTAFRRYLEAEGWSVTLERDHIDVFARRGEETMIAEAKGQTANPSVDIDTLYGQLLRRMGMMTGESVRYAAVVPASFLTKVMRVSVEVRRRLGIEIFVVDDDDSVETVTD